MSISDFRKMMRGERGHRSVRASGSAWYWKSLTLAISIPVIVAINIVALVITLVTVLDKKIKSKLIERFGGKSPDVAIFASIISAVVISVVYLITCLLISHFMTKKYNILSDYNKYVDFNVLYKEQLQQSFGKIKDGLNKSPKDSFVKELMDEFCQNITVIRLGNQEFVVAKIAKLGVCIVMPIDNYDLKLDLEEKMHVDFKDSPSPSESNNNRCFILFEKELNAKDHQDESDIRFFADVLSGRDDEQLKRSEGYRSAMTCFDRLYSNNLPTESSIMSFELYGALECVVDVYKDHIPSEVSIALKDKFRLQKSLGKASKTVQEVGEGFQDLFVSVMQVFSRFQPAEFGSIMPKAFLMGAVESALASRKANDTPDMGGMITGIANTDSFFDKMTYIPAIGSFMIDFGEYKIFIKKNPADEQGKFTMNGVSVYAVFNKEFERESLNDQGHRSIFGHYIDGNKSAPITEKVGDAPEDALLKYIKLEYKVGSDSTFTQINNLASFFKSTFPSVSASDKSNVELFNKFSTKLLEKEAAVLDSTESMWTGIMSMLNSESDDVVTDMSVAPNNMLSDKPQGKHILSSSLTMSQEGLVLVEMDDGSMMVMSNKDKMKDTKLYAVTLHNEWVRKEEEDGFLRVPLCNFGSCTMKGGRYCNITKNKMIQYASLLNDDGNCSDLSCFILDSEEALLLKKYLVEKYSVSSGQVLTVKHFSDIRKSRELKRWGRYNRPGMCLSTEEEVSDDVNDQLNDGEGQLKDDSSSESLEDKMKPVLVEKLVKARHLLFGLDSHKLFNTQHILIDALSPIVALEIANQCIGDTENSKGNLKTINLSNTSFLFKVLGRRNEFLHNADLMKYLNLLECRMHDTQKNFDHFCKNISIDNQSVLSKGSMAYLGFIDACNNIIRLTPYLFMRTKEQGICPIKAMTTVVQFSIVIMDMLNQAIDKNDVESIDNIFALYLVLSSLLEYEGDAISYQERLDLLNTFMNNRSLINNFNYKQFCTDPNYSMLGDFMFYGTEKVALRTHLVSDSVEKRKKYHNFCKKIVDIDIAQYDVNAYITSGYSRTSRDYIHNNAVHDVSGRINTDGIARKNGFINRGMNFYNYACMIDKFSRSIHLELKSVPPVEEEDAVGHEQQIPIVDAKEAYDFFVNFIPRDIRYRALHSMSDCNDLVFTDELIKASSGVSWDDCVTQFVDSNLYKEARALEAKDIVFKKNALSTMVLSIYSDVVNSNAYTQDDLDSFANIFKRIYELPDEGNSSLANIIKSLGEMEFGSGTEKFSDYLKTLHDTKEFSKLSTALIHSFHDQTHSDNIAKVGCILRDKNNQYPQIGAHKLMSHVFLKNHMSDFDWVKDVSIINRINRSIKAYGNRMSCIQKNNHIYSKYLKSLVVAGSNGNTAADNKMLSLSNMLDFIMLKSKYSKSVEKVIGYLCNKTSGRDALDLANITVEHIKKFLNDGTATVMNDNDYSQILHLAKSSVLFASVSHKYKTNDQEKGLFDPKVAAYYADDGVSKPNYADIQKNKLSFLAVSTYCEATIAADKFNNESALILSEQLSHYNTMNSSLFFNTFSFMQGLHNELAANADLLSSNEIADFIDALMSFIDEDMEGEGKGEDTVRRIAVYCAGDKIVPFKTIHSALLSGDMSCLEAPYAAIASILHQHKLIVKSEHVHLPLRMLQDSFCLNKTSVQPSINTYFNAMFKNHGINEQGIQSMDLFHNFMQTDYNTSSFTVSSIHALFASGFEDICKIANPQVKEQNIARFTKFMSLMRKNSNNKEFMGFLTLLLSFNATPGRFILPGDSFFFNEDGYINFDALKDFYTALYRNTIDADGEVNKDELKKYLAKTMSNGNDDQGFVEVSNAPSWVGLEEDVRKSLDVPVRVETECKNTNDESMNPRDERRDFTSDLVMPYFYTPERGVITPDVSFNVHSDSGDKSPLDSISEIVDSLDFGNDAAKLLSPLLKNVIYMNVQCAKLMGLSGNEFLRDVVAKMATDIGHQAIGGFAQSVALLLPEDSSKKPIAVDKLKSIRKMLANSKYGKNRSQMAAENVNESNSQNNKVLLIDIINSVIDRSAKSNQKLSFADIETFFINHIGTSLLNLLGSDTCNIIEGEFAEQPLTRSLVKKVLNNNTDIKKVLISKNATLSDLIMNDTSLMKGLLSHGVNVMEFVDPKTWSDEYFMERGYSYRVDAKEEGTRNAEFMRCINALDSVKDSANAAFMESRLLAIENILIQEVDIDLLLELDGVISSEEFKYMEMVHQKLEQHKQDIQSSSGINKLVNINAFIFTFIAAVERFNGYKLDVDADLGGLDIKSELNKLIDQYVTVTKKFFEPDSVELDDIKNDELYAVYLGSKMSEENLEEEESVDPVKKQVEGVMKEYKDSLCARTSVEQVGVENIDREATSAQDTQPPQRAL